MIPIPEDLMVHWKRHHGVNQEAEFQRFMTEYQEMNDEEQQKFLDMTREVIAFYTKIEGRKMNETVAYVGAIIIHLFGFLDNRDQASIVANDLIEAIQIGANNVGN